ncbi:DegV family protein [Clostridium sp. 'deep sea']|uniref:DegV family protein n=1 Tax=Clostridium sp. 'deep sea' TaxID=2779445 RepID=UPI0018967E71|nr:DegV family protein [Clostridium sp. 'deep sea']QOR34902.1 DegV family protein [Clostridium sp. 'deep sea']
MRKIAIVTDSASDLPDNIIDQYNISILPLRIIYKDREYRDRLEIKPQEVYEVIEKEVPTTSLPTAGDILAVFDNLAEQGYQEALVITLSSNLSGTYKMVNMLAKDYDKLTIKVLDSKTLGMFLGFLVIKAAELAETHSIDEIIKQATALRAKLKGGYIVRTLSYLRKGGRIGKVEGTVGELLSIKPIIGINDDGVYHTIGKTRGWARAKKKLTKMIKDEFYNKNYIIAIIHGGALEEAQEMHSKLKDIGNVVESYISQISPALGVHTGPGLIGFAAYEV